MPDCHGVSLWKRVLLLSWWRRPANPCLEAQCQILWSSSQALWQSVMPVVLMRSCNQWHYLYLFQQDNTHSDTTANLPLRHWYYVYYAYYSMLIFLSGMLHLIFFFLVTFIVLPNSIKILTLPSGCNYFLKMSVCQWNTLQRRAQTFFTTAFGLYFLLL